MDKLEINGKENLSGSISVHGAKNSALPILVSSLLNLNRINLHNIPQVEDINNMIKLLEGFGAAINRQKNSVILNCKNIKNITADYDIVRKMRASILILGPLLSRFGHAKISLPGGCAIGTRPIDIHLEGLKKLGVQFKIENGFIIGKVKSMLKGNKIILPFPSVGATENILMSAILADGETTIENSAKEPEITDLANFLISMGAKIEGQGTNKIWVKGVTSLVETSYKIISDRIVAGTFIILSIMLNAKVEVNNINTDDLAAVIKVLNDMGANLKIKKNAVLIGKSDKLKSINVETSPYPGFPTDLQAQLMSLMCIAEGQSQIKETIFENRFMHVPELNRLGANIKVIKDTAFIEGNQKFKGAQVMASDLRASVSLILAALCSEGKTTINRVYHLDRGYENIEKKLKLCGAKIERINQ